MDVREIKIDEIQIQENYRTNVSEKSLKELMLSIEQNGLIQPIGVSENPSGGFILRFGQRRFLACKKLKWKTIPAIIENLIAIENILFESLIENLQREDPSFEDFGRGIDRLRNRGLSNDRIAKRLGVPKNKIQEILSVYDGLPEKLRSKVVFVTKGKKRKKGTVPALTANKLAIMKNQHNLDKKDVDLIFQESGERDLDRKDLNHVSNMISTGVGVDQALQNMRDYDLVSVEIVASYEEISQKMQEYGLINRQHLFRKVFYGEIPPFKKPDFVSTGICHAFESTAQDKGIDIEPFVKMFRDLKRFAKEGRLDENQLAAIKSLSQITRKEWREAHCEQIKSIYNDINSQASERRS